MTNIHSSIPLGSTHHRIVPLRFVQRFRSWLARMAEDRRIARDALKLRDLNDRLLRDMGIHRADVELMVRRRRRSEN